MTSIDHGRSAATHRVTPPPADSRALRLTSPDDVLARVPFLLGFHPRDSLVLLGFDRPGRHRVLRLTTRFDLPPDDLGPERLRAYGEHVAQALARNGVQVVYVIAYTSDRARACRTVAAVGPSLDAQGIEVDDVLSADGSRWWHERCAGDCACPAEGTPYDLATHPVTAAAIFDGEIALADEEELRRSLEPILGLTRIGMEAATVEVYDEIARRFGVHARPGGSGAPAGVELVDTGGFVAAGLRYVTDIATGWLASPRRLGDHEVAWTGCYLRHLTVRDEAWALMDRSSAPRFVEFWRDIARRAVPPYHVAPMTLLAFAAWLAGNGALAVRAVDRALDGDHEYGLARLLEELLAAGIPGSEWNPHPRVLPAEPVDDRALITTRQDDQEGEST
ncbi:MAG TPA: DUF4192 domain-containing protein [Actinopolymorphaceae bacterium]